MLHQLHLRMMLCDSDWPFVPLLSFLLTIAWCEFNVHTPNVVFEWLTLLLLIRRSWLQISTRRPAILTEGFVVFLSPSRRMPGFVGGLVFSVLTVLFRLEISVSGLYLCWMWNPIKRKVVSQKQSSSYLNYSDVTKERCALLPRCEKLQIVAFRRCLWNEGWEKADSEYSLDVANWRHWLQCIGR
jgi:hypothetical protein